MAGIRPSPLSAPPRRLPAPAPRVPGGPPERRPGRLVPPRAQGRGAPAALRLGASLRPLGGAGPARSRAAAGGFTAAQVTLVRVRGRAQAVTLALFHLRPGHVPAGAARRSSSRAGLQGGLAVLLYFLAHRADPGRPGDAPQQPLPDLRRRASLALHPGRAPDGPPRARPGARRRRSASSWRPAAATLGLDPGVAGRPRLGDPRRRGGDRDPRASRDRQRADHLLLLLRGRARSARSPSSGGPGRRSPPVGAGGARWGCSPSSPRSS